MKQEPLHDFWKNVFFPYLRILATSLKNYWKFEKVTSKIKIPIEFVSQELNSPYYDVDIAYERMKDILHKYIIDTSGTGYFLCWIWINYESNNLCIPYKQVVSIEFSEGSYKIKNKGDIGELNFINSLNNSISINHVEKSIQFSLLDSWSTILDNYYEVNKVFKNFSDWFFDLFIGYEHISVIKYQIDALAQEFLENAVDRVIKKLKKLDNSFGFYGNRYTTWDSYCISVQNNNYNYIELYEYEVWKAINSVYSSLKFDSLFLLSYFAFHEKNMFYSRNNYNAPNDIYESEILLLIHSEVLEMANVEINRNIRREINFDN